jgi:hypothetical protein
VKALTRSLSVPTLLLTAGLVLGPLSRSAYPQDPIETVFSTNSNNDRLLRLDFRTGAVELVNTDADALDAKRLEGIAVRDDPPGTSIIACDSRGNRLLFYSGVQGPDRVAGQTIASVPQPDGVSVDALGNLFLVSSPTGSEGPKVWTLARGGTRPGGYGDPVLIDGAVPSDYLEDTKVANFSAGLIEAGDVLVVSRRPAQIFRYRLGTSGWDRQVLVPSSVFPGSAKPTGLAFSPGRELLVSTWGGDILRFDASGLRVRPDFAGRLGSGRLKIAVGVQEDKTRAFVANRSQGGKVLRFLVQADGTGAADGAVEDSVSQPNGVGIASSTAAPTPVGTNVTVNPAPEVSITFDNVVTAGLTTARLIEIADNRSCPSQACEQSLKAFFPDDPLLQELLPDVTIPAYTQGFKKLLPGDSPGSPSGPSTFLLAIIDTTAVFTRTAQAHFEEELRGIGGTCAGLGPQSAQEYEPRTFYAPETDPPKSEPGVVENQNGRVFVDISDGCGSNKGSGWNFSLYLTARDTRTATQIVTTKLANLRLTLQSFADFIAPAVFAELDGHLHDAETAFASFLDTGAQADRDATAAALEAFRSAVDQHTAEIDNAGAHRNLTGELIARASSALFILPKVSVTETPGTAVEIMIGDNDGYGNAFGLLAGPVPDDGSFPETLLGPNGSYVPRDGRSAAEKGATNGAQQTDFYSAMVPAKLPKVPIGLPSSFDLVFPVLGRLTKATLEVDMGSFQSSDSGQISVSINGVPQNGFFAFSDGQLRTRVRKIPLMGDRLKDANAARPLRITISRGKSVDFVAFDYFKLSGEVVP